MYNYVFLVGRLVRDIEVRKTENGKDVSTMTLAVTRSFKNTQTNTYDADFINISLWEPFVGSVAEHAKKGDALAVKGRLQTRKEDINGKNIYTQEVVAERVLFLSLNKQSLEVKDEG